MPEVSKGAKSEQATFHALISRRKFLRLTHSQSKPSLALKYDGVGGAGEISMSGNWL